MALQYYTAIQPMHWARICAYLNHQAVSRLACTRFEPYLGTLAVRDDNKRSFMLGVQLALEPALGIEIIEKLRDLLID